jgi:hypothetical protein
LFYTFGAEEYRATSKLALGLGRSLTPGFTNPHAAKYRLHF